VLTTASSHLGSRNTLTEVTLKIVAIPCAYDCELEMGTRHNVNKSRKALRAANRNVIGCQVQINVTDKVVRKNHGHKCGFELPQVW
jgi:hypothetical protein